MAETDSSASGRLAGGKSPSYRAAVNELESRASRFTVRYMLASDIAYVLTAAELGFTPASAAAKLLPALLSLFEESNRIDTMHPPGDVVSQREAWVAEKAGREATAWLHLGRNRGESLRNYLPRMFFRQTLYEEGQAITQLLINLLKRADPLLEALAPNYHHLQHSGFTTVGEYLLSWVVVFERHLQRLEQVDQRLDKGPSAFGGRPGVNDLFDRVSRRLGFSNRARLRRDGYIRVQDQFTEPFFVLSLVAVDLSRLAQDLRTWMTPEFSLIELADEHAGGSSALPHAKVPFGLQAVIGTAAMAATRLAGEMTAAGNLSEGSEPLYQSATLYMLAKDIVASTVYMADIIEKCQFNLEELKRKALLDYAGSSEAHDRLVYDFGVPFRTGHRVLGSLVRNHHEGGPPIDLKEVLRKETGNDVDVDQDEIMDIVLGRKFLPTAFDQPMLRETLATYARKAEAAKTKFAGPSPTESAIDGVVKAAQSWLTSKSANTPQGLSR